MVAFTLNGKPVVAKSEPDTPLLWVVRDELKLTGTKYGAMAQSGPGVRVISRASVHNATGGDDVE